MPLYKSVKQLSESTPLKQSIAPNQCLRPYAYKHFILPYLLTKGIKEALASSVFLSKHPYYEAPLKPRYGKIHMPL